VTLEVFDVGGRLVERRDLGLQHAGVREASLDGRGHGAGVYLYRIKALDPANGTLRAALNGKAVLLK
jgi:hypothetical protein